MKGDKTQLRTPQIRPYPLQEKFKILFLGGYVYDVTNSMQLYGFSLVTLVFKCILMEGFEYHRSNVQAK